MTAAWLAWGAVLLFFAVDTWVLVRRRKRALRVWEEACAAREQKQIAALADEAILREVAETFEREHSR